MKKAAPLLIRVPEDLSKHLDELASTTPRSKSDLIVRAIEEFVMVQEWQVVATKEALAEVDAGQVVPHEVVDELNRWDAELVRSLVDAGHVASDNSDVPESFRNEIVAAKRRGKVSPFIPKKPGKQR
jgi:predicted transcriptional regulator